MPHSINVGRRKTAVARVYLTPGSGKVTVNGREFENYFPDGFDRMAVLSPLNAVEMVRKYHPGLGAVVITGDTGAEPLRALQRCSVPVLHKPFPAEALLMAIEQQLNGHLGQTSQAA